MRKAEMDHSVFNMLRLERDRCIRVIDRVTDEIKRIDADQVDAEKDESSRPVIERRLKVERDLEVAKMRRDTIRYILEKCTDETENEETTTFTPSPHRKS
jgi:hypothetical protein